MFGFLFKYDLKRAILNKEALFWVLIFPFFMAMLLAMLHLSSMIWHLHGYQ